MSSRITNYSLILVNEFRLRSVAFFTNVFSSEGVEIDPRKTELVKSCPRPLSPIHI